MVFLCQNNGIAISTPAHDALATDGVARWARGYRLPAITVDGNDVVAVADAVRDAADQARAGGGPMFVEAITYRITGHFRADPAAYQDPEEKAAWHDRHPIRRLEDSLRQNHGIGPGELASVWQRCDDQVRSGAAELEAQPHLTAADLGLPEVYGHAD